MREDMLPALRDPTMSVYRRILPAFERFGFRLHQRPSLLH